VTRQSYIPQPRFGAPERAIGHLSGYFDKPAPAKWFFPGRRSGRNDKRAAGRNEGPEVNVIVAGVR